VPYRGQEGTGSTYGRRHEKRVLFFRFPAVPD
jgi:hypothetical protein